MTSQAPKGQPPQAPPAPKMSSQQSGGTKGGYVGRYKLQQQRIRALNQMENTASEMTKRIQKSLPKIHPDTNKENLVIRAVQRSNTMDVIKLPGVRGGGGTTVKPPHVLSHKRKTLPVKTFHLRVNPDHTSFISKSLPSLPSIPGSPSYTEDQAVSPLTDRTMAKAPVFMGKHRYEKIAFQKRLHRESTEWLKNHPGEDPNTFNDNAATKAEASKRTRAGQGDRGHGINLPTMAGYGAQDKPHTSGSVRIRYSKLARDAVSISETQSEPGTLEVSRKWRENCKCLRCQMLKRQYHEGDEHYSLWGRYPCHHIDPSIMLDD